MRHDYLGFVERLHREHGDLAVTQLGHEQVWDLMSPELAREALVNHADHLIRWERGIEVFAEAFGQSVLVTEGATWQCQRRMLMPAFTSVLPQPVPACTPTLNVTLRQKEPLALRLVRRTAASAATPLSV